MKILIALLAIVFFNGACNENKFTGSGKKKSEGAAAGSGDSTVEKPTEQPTDQPAEQPTEVPSVDAVQVEATIQSAPMGYSKVTQLAAYIAGKNVVKYLYKVGLEQHTNCNDKSGYSSIRDVRTNITDNIASLSDGVIAICAIGQDDQGNQQSFDNPTRVVWTKDTTPPVVNAGLDLTTSAKVFLNGSVTDASTYQVLWSVAAGSNLAVSFDNTGTAQTYVTASSVSAYTLRLTATDAAGNVGYDDMILTWQTVTVPPACTLTANHTKIIEGDTVVLTLTPNMAVSSAKIETTTVSSSGGQISLQPNATKTYTGYVVANSQTQTCQVEVTVSKMEECLETPKTLPTTQVNPTKLYSWTGYDSYTHVLATPVVGYLRSTDTSPSIVFPAYKNGALSYATAGKLFAINGSNGSTKWESSLDFYAGTPAAIADLDGDGENEVIAVEYSGNTVALNGSDGSLKWRSDSKQFQGDSTWGIRGGPIVADLNGDGNVEVITQVGVLNGRTGVMMGSYFESFSRTISTPIVADVNKNSPGLEVVTPYGILAANDRHVICNFPVALVGVAAGKVYASDTSMSIVGVYYSNFPNPASAIYVINGDSCSVRYSNTIPGGGGGGITIADFDGDKNLDYGVAGYSYYTVFNSDATVKWKQDVDDSSSYQTGSTSFDLNGDGKTEVLYSDQYKFRVFDGSTGRVLYQTPNTSVTLYENPVVADVDGDGHANIVLASTGPLTNVTSTAGINVFRAPANDWVGTRPIWNQYAFYGFNVSDKGSVVNLNKEPIWKPWFSEERLLGFRNNTPILPLNNECRN